jgi:serine/threonine protein kinase
LPSTAAILRPGDTLGGFHIGDVIGIGGMAIVYRAEQVSLGRPVALKVLSTKLTSDEVFCERFRREGMHAATLEHPNIVPVYDSGEQDGLLYLAMRLVDGTNLAELIQTRGLTADQTIETLRPIASALDTAHAAGLIHRDVKPQNVLITTQGHPYLADFGVAKGSNTDGLTATGGFVGSVNYASPEQIKGLTLTPASDIYGLTAVLYQCLTGHVPYPRETDAGIMHAHLTEPPPTLPALTGVDSDFHTVFARGMAKDPGARYGHAGDMITAAAVSVGRMPTARRKAVPAFPDEISRQVSPVPSARSAGDSGIAQAGPAGAGTEIVAAAELSLLRGTTGHTTADRRRSPAPEPEPEPVSSHRRWPLPAGIAAVVAAIALAVVLLSPSGGTRAKAGSHTHISRPARPPSPIHASSGAANVTKARPASSHPSVHASGQLHHRRVQAHHVSVEAHQLASATANRPASPGVAEAGATSQAAPAPSTPATSSAPASGAPVPNTPTPSTPTPHHNAPQVVVSAPK